MNDQTLHWTLDLLVPRGWMTLFAFVLPALPLAALAYGAERPDRFAWIAVLIQLGATLYLMLPPSAMHDCDRKGSGAELAVIFLVPLSLILASLVLLLRRPGKQHE